MRCKGHTRGARASDVCKGLIFCLFIDIILMIINMIWCKGLNERCKGLNEWCKGRNEWCKGL